MISLTDDQFQAQIAGPSGINKKSHTYCNIIIASMRLITPRKQSSHDSYISLGFKIKGLQGPQE